MGVLKGLELINIKKKKTGILGRISNTSLR